MKTAFNFWPRLISNPENKTKYINIQIHLWDSKDVNLWPYLLYIYIVHNCFSSLEKRTVFSHWLKLKCYITVMLIWLFLSLLSLNLFGCFYPLGLPVLWLACSYFSLCLMIVSTYSLVRARYLLKALQNLSSGPGLMFLKKFLWNTPTQFWIAGTYTFTSW